MEERADIEGSSKQNRTSLKEALKSTSDETSQSWNSMKKEEFKDEDSLDGCEMNLLTSQRTITINLIKQALKILWKIVDSPEIDRLINPIKIQLSFVLQQVEESSEVGESNPIENVVIKEEPDEDELLPEVFVAIETVSEEESPRKRKKYKKREVKPSKSEIDSQTVPCEHCDRVFAKRKQMMHHYYSTHMGPCFCDRCGKMFQSKHHLMKHMRTHESLDVRRVKCPQCDLMVMPDSLIRHIKARHEGIKGFKW
jgi:hypothetical protein